MTLKQLIIAIKHGGTTQSVMEKFHFSSEEKFFQTIKNMASIKYDEIIRQLKRNDKRALKIDTVSEDTNIDTSVNTKSTHKAPVEYDANIDIETDAEANILNETTKDTEETQVSELEMLQKDETEISQLLCDLEGKHKALVGERKQIADSLKKTKKLLETLLQKIAEYEEEVTTKWVQYNSLESQMKALDLEIANNRQLLEIIRTRIEELQQVFILVTSDTIEVENAEIPSINPQEISIIFTKLLTIVEAEELTIKELKTIARLLIIVKKLDTYEILFENPKMGTLFEQFKDM